MALIFVDSFDHYSTADALSKWNAGTAYTIATGGRDGTRCFQGSGTSSYLRKELVNNIASTESIIVGFAYKAEGTNLSADVLQFLNTLAQQTCSLRINLNNTLSLFVAASVATSDKALLQNIWYYIEVKLKVANSGGSYELRVNGEVWSTFSGDTSNQATDDIKTVTFRPVHSPSKIDDVYIASSTGGTITNFIGDVRVTYLTVMPVDSGRAYREWTPLSTYSYQDVDDLSPDSDTTYIYASGIKALESFFVNSTPSGMSLASTLYGIQVGNYVRKVSAGTPDPLQNIIYSAYSNSYSGGQPYFTGDPYSYMLDVFEKVPISGGTTRAPTFDDISSGMLQFGIYKTN